MWSSLTDVDILFSQSVHFAVYLGILFPHSTHTYIFLSEILNYRQNWHEKPSLVRQVLECLSVEISFLKDFGNSSKNGHANARICQGGVLKIFKTWPQLVLGNLLWVSLVEQGSGQDDLQVSSNLNHYVILWVWTGATGAGEKQKWRRAFYPHWKIFTLSCTRLPLHNPIPYLPALHPLSSLQRFVDEHWRHFCNDSPSRIIQKRSFCAGHQKKKQLECCQSIYFGDTHGETVRNHTLKS